MNNSLQSSFSNEFLIKIIQMTQTSTEHTKCPNSTISLIFKRKFYHEKSTKEMFNITCVTAAGWRAGNTRFTFVLAGVGSNRCTRRVITATRSSVTVMNTISTLMGGHALASLKGGGPCSLGTFNYGVASHLAFPLT